MPTVHKLQACCALKSHQADISVRTLQGWDVFVNNTGQVPGMVIFSCALWDIARFVGTIPNGM